MTAGTSFLPLLSIVMERFDSMVFISRLCSYNRGSSITRTSASTIECRLLSSEGVLDAAIRPNTMTWKKQQPL
jgi:hypothetical protein